MMIGPHPRMQKVSTNYAGRPSSTMGTNVVSGGSAHALSASFVEIFSATEHDTYWLEIIIHDTAAGATDTDTLLNIYRGANGSEVLFIDSLLAGWSGLMTTGDGFKTYGFPLYIPKGTRITAKSRSVQTSKNVYVMMALHGGGHPMGWFGMGVETLGENTAASSGTAVDPGDASEGSFTDIGTTGRQYGFIMPQVGGNSDTIIANAMITFDIGSGGAVIQGLENFLFSADGGDEVVSNCNSGRYCTIPAGTALQIRGQSGTSTAENKDLCIYGVY